MTLSQAFFLSIIQGLTEFLPVSSSGHLVVFQKILGLKSPVLFDILVHVGTLGAVFFFFKTRLFEIIRGLARQEEKAVSLVKLIIIGSLPAIAAGFFIRPFLEAIFDSLPVVSLGLFLTTAFLFSTKTRRRNYQPYQLNKGQSFLIGLSQALAILPGVSRSGATISAGLYQGLDRETAFEFSFLLAIPAILGALVLEIPDLVNSSSDFLFHAVLGMFIAGMVGCLTLKIIKKVLLGRKFWAFGIYSLALGLFLLWGWG